MRFKEEHKNYERYESDEFYFAELPNEFSAALQGFITRHCEDERELKAVINDIAGRIPTEPTKNWGWDFLMEDLSDRVTKFCKLPMPKIMDFLSDACIKQSRPFSVKDLNELLKDHDVGYVLTADRLRMSTSWTPRSSVSSRAEAVEDTIPDVEGICLQALDHLKQAREHLRISANDRDGKDAIRDGMSAMESILKKLSGKSDIRAATTELRNEATWGPIIIVKDGISLWTKMHDLYPDIRHGNPNKSDLTEEEVLYWFERITCFIRYMSRVSKKRR